MGATGRFNPGVGSRGRKGRIPVGRLEGLIIIWSGSREGTSRIILVWRRIRGRIRIRARVRVWAKSWIEFRGIGVKRRRRRVYWVGRSRRITRWCIGWSRCVRVRELFILK